MLGQLTMLWLHHPAQACCFWLPLGSRWVPLLCSGTAPFCSLLVPSFCNQSASCVSSVRLVHKPLFLSLRGSDKLRKSRLYIMPTPIKQLSSATILNHYVMCAKAHTCWHSIRQTVIQRLRL